MKEMKRILSLFLCLAMLVGYLPVGALATENESATEPSLTADAVIETTVPETTVPETTVPETTVPETTVPETTVPETTVPETTVPETTVPETTVPETTVPETTVPETTVPETTVPETTVPETTEATEPAEKTPVRKPSKKPSSKVTEEAAGEVAPQDPEKDYLFFAADGNTGVADMIGSMEAKIGKNQLDYLGLIGTDASVLAEITGAAAGLTADNVGFVLPDVEDQDEDAVIYEGTKFYVYGTAMSEDADAQEFLAWANGDEIDAAKTLIVLSDAPLHNNGDAASWIQALNTLAAGEDAVIDRNVVFFWNSDVQEESDEEQDVAYVEADGTIPAGEEEIAVYFTYAKAGSLAEENAAILVTVTEENVTVEKYVGADVTDTHSMDRVAPAAEPEAPAETEETVPAETDAPALVELKVAYSNQTLLGEELALNVVAVYDDGTTKELTSEEYQLATGYGRLGSGSQTYIVSYGEQSHAFMVSTDGETGVSVVADEMESLTVTDVTAEEDTVYALTDAFVGEFAAYDITPDKYNTESSPAVVSMPAPEGSTGVYYWNREDSKLERMEDVVFENGKAVFTTSHFSTYIVGSAAAENETEITVPNPESKPGTGTATGTETKEVYVLVSSINGAGEYLISNTNTGSNANLLTVAAGGVANTPGVPVETGTDAAGKPVTYIEKDKAAAAAVWTAESSGSGYKLKATAGESTRYLRLNGSYNGLTSDTSSDSATVWTAANNGLFYSFYNYYYMYVQYSSSSWTISYNSQTVYIYQKQNVDFRTTDNNAPGTYSIAGEDISRVVKQNDTAQLKATLTFVPDEGDGYTQDVSTTATYTVASGTKSDGTAINGDPNGIIAKDENGNPMISGNTITFSGKQGKALIQVSHTVNGNVVTNYITVEALVPYYTIDITEGVKDKDNNITYTVVPSGKILAVKEVEDGKTLQLGHDGLKLIDDEILTDDAVDTATYQVEWSCSNTDIATVEDGLVTFEDIEENDTIQITVVAYEMVNGEKNVLAKDTVTVTVSPTAYYTPEDGKEQMPDYPGEGAVVIDKNAKAVGNFNETGIAQIELSMFGVPAGGEPVDVILVVDKSSSMANEHRSERAMDAAKAFVDGLKTNSENRLAIVTYDDQGSGVPGDVILPLSALTAETVTRAYAQIETFDDNRGNATNYVAGLTATQTILNGIDNDRQKFVVFLSDGAPTNYQPVEANSAQVDHTDGRGGATSTWMSGNNRDANKWKYERYTTQMKAAGVTVYTVGLGITVTQPKLLLNDMAGPAYEEEQPDKPGTGTKSKLGKYYFEVADANAATELKSVFEGIASEIAAASNVTVKDLVTKDYSVVFQRPTAVAPADLPDGQEFYLEIVKYALDDNHERTGTAIPVQKIYMVQGSGTEYLVSSSNSAAGKLTEVTDEKAALKDNEVYYYEDHSADNPHFKTKYFAYDAGYTRVNEKGEEENNPKLDWNADTLSADYDIALRYFVYLENSVDGKLEAGPYSTNVEATVSYTNHLGNPCIQTFPVPQMTWNGAQVSYVFYLVDDYGNPINQSGEKVDFRAAVFVTDVFTEDVKWNDAEGITSLKVNTIASQKLPTGYTLYDPNAEYNLHVYETTGYFKYDAQGNRLESSVNEEGAAAEFNWFEIITGSNATNKTTTKVYNTQAGKRYETAGVYSDENVDAVTYYVKDENGNTQALKKDVTNPGTSDIDFYATTVAFAVKWTHKVMDDTVVVDYGLPVKIDVVKNDLLQNQIHGLSKTAPAATNAIYNISNFTGSIEEEGVFTAVNDTNSVTFTQKSMQFQEPVEFYYDTAVAYTEKGIEKNGYMCAKVTVIPATSIYYEDSFVTFTGSSKSNPDSPTYDAVLTESGKYGTWSKVGSTVNATQDQDRPGPNKIAEALDADNVYGFDKAYEKMSQYSLGSAMKVKVKSGVSGMASFDFYGTGFDVISMTDKTTGTIIVEVSTEDDTVVYEGMVDTYYGYAYENGQWVVVDDADPNAMYQVPVIKVTGLPYGPKYTAKIVASYVRVLDHTEEEGYDFYMDAVRVYDPTGNRNETANDAYKQDGEGWPIYQELRNNVINASDLTDDEVNGAVFIDGIGETTKLSDYIGYGPNNELYLDNNQMIAFSLNFEGYNANIAKVQLGLKSADGKPVNYAIADAEKLKTADDLVNAANRTVTTATDMYYDITDLKDKYIVIYNHNNSEGILSLTDIKVTFENDPVVGEDNFFYVNVSTIMNILSNLQTVAPEMPDDDEDLEIWPLEVTVELPEIAKSGSEFEVKISAVDAEKVTVETSDENAEVTVKASDYEEFVWIANVKPSELGTMTLTVQATSEGYSDTTVEAQVLVYSYTPTNFEVTYTPNPRANAPITFTVTTSDDVAAVRIAGTLVTTYKVKDGMRIWTKTETMREGEYDVSVIAYNQEGYESEKMVTITVGPAMRTVAQIVKNTVSNIAKNLLTWFKK